MCSSMTTNWGSQQGAMHGRLGVWQTDLVNPIFAEFAKNCGGLGLFVDDPADFEEALVRAIAAGGSRTRRGSHGFGSVCISTAARACTVLL